MTAPVDSLEREVAKVLALEPTVEKVMDIIRDAVRNFGCGNDSHCHETHEEKAACVTAFCVDLSRATTTHVKWHGCDYPDNCDITQRHAQETP